MNLTVSYHSEVHVENYVTINGETFRIHYNGGYLYVYIPATDDEPARNMGLHRLLMELHLGRRLLPTEHVHHKDGNRQNNALDNLEVVLGADHNRRHTRDRNLRHDPDSFVCRQCKRGGGVRHKAHGLCTACFAKRKRHLRAERPCLVCHRETKGGRSYHRLCRGCACKSWSSCRLCLRPRDELPKTEPRIGPEGLCRACETRTQRQVLAAPALAA